MQKTGPQIELFCMGKVEKRPFEGPPRDGRKSDVPSLLAGRLPCPGLPHHFAGQIAYRRPSTGHIHAAACEQLVHCEQLVRPLPVVGRARATVWEVNAGEAYGEYIQRGCQPRHRGRL